MEVKGKLKIVFTDKKNHRVKNVGSSGLGSRYSGSQSSREPHVAIPS